jgi:hypothetical protein
MARSSQKVLTTWYDRNGGDANKRLAYTLLDDKCQPIVENKTAIAVANGYFEFHDGAIDAVGNAVVAVSPNGATRVNWIDASGVAKVQQDAFNINALYGTHVAMNQATGEGILVAQIHSGNGIHYRRFNANGTWKDPAAVPIPVNYHYWYDGFTVGMNDKGEFAVLWRSDGTVLDMRFFNPDGSVKQNVQRSTIDFEEWDGGHCYDSFRRRHQELPLRGDNFVLGEVYNWITPQQNRITHHFEYTPPASSSPRTAPPSTSTRACRSASTSRALATCATTRASTSSPPTPEKARARAQARPPAPGSHLSLWTCHAAPPRPRESVHCDHDAAPDRAPSPPVVSRRRPR